MSRLTLPLLAVLAFAALHALAPNEAELNAAAEARIDRMLCERIGTMIDEQGRVVKCAP